jgi:PAS domain S-box-containing protein
VDVETPARVMVVDDDEAGRYMLRTFLEGHGFEVVAAADGVEALELARREPVDIVVTDILMPRMDGYRMAREWKADPELRATPFIFYTATYTDSADERFAMDLGADRFVSKPTEPHELLGVVREVLEEVSRRGVAPRTPRLDDESEILREYSGRLVNKLEHKVAEVNEVNEDLHRAIEVLSDEVEVKNDLIEQRGRAEAELREANELLSAIISATPLAVVATDTHGVVSMWNPAAERILGMTAEQILGKPLPFVPPGTMESYVAGERPYRDPTQALSVQVRRADGRDVDLDMWMASVNAPDGSIRRLLAVIQDVTERRQVEQIKSDFLSMVSHELRTPLTGIIGYADLLCDRAAREGEGASDLADRIREKANVLRTLVERLLEISSLQAGAVRLSKQPVDPESLVRDAIDRMKARGSREVSCTVEPGLPEIVCDPDLIRRSVSSLLGNAAKFSPEGGPISVTLSRSDGEARIAVTDTGIGISAELAEHIFDLFTQGDMSSTRSYAGVGLGLFAARQAVRAHGGRMEVASTPGAGSTFTIILPIEG